MKPYHNESMCEYISRAGMDPGTESGIAVAAEFNLESQYLETRLFDCDGELSEGYVFRDDSGVESVTIDFCQGSMLFGEDWINENQREDLP